MYNQSFRLWNSKNNTIMATNLNQTFTCENNDYVPTWEDILKACIIVFVSLGIIIGNVFSAIVFNHSDSTKLFLKKVRLTMNSLICTDLSMGLLVCPFCVYSALYKCWPYSETFCKIEALLISALFHESTLSLVLISLDRYFSVHHYLKYNSFMTSRKYVIIILTTWTITFCVYAFVIFYGEQFYFDKIGVNCEPYYVNHNVTLSVIAIFYVLPSILFIFSYGSIFVVANRKENIRVFPRKGRVSESRSHAVSQILKTSKYLAAITMGFFIAVTPWTLCTLVIALTGIKLNETVDFAVTWIAISNSFWNVIIYCAMNRKFRQAAVSLTSRHRLRRFLNARNFSSETREHTSNSRDTELTNCETIPYICRHVTDEESDEKLEQIGEHSADIEA